MEVGESVGIWRYRNAEMEVRRSTAQRFELSNLNRRTVQCVGPRARDAAGDRFRRKAALRETRMTLNGRQWQLTKVRMQPGAVVRAGDMGTTFLGPAA